MRYILIILMLFSLSSCSFSRLSRYHDNIDPEFMPYIKEFIYASRGTIKMEDFANLTMGFRNYDQSTSTIGTCWPMPHMIEIDISREWWTYNRGSISRQSLIFHELGHCILNRYHTSKPIEGDGFLRWLERFMFDLGFAKQKLSLEDGCPASLMHPYAIDEQCLMAHYQYYLEELFTEISYADFTMRNKKQFLIEECAKPFVSNETNTWTEIDRRTLEIAKKRCLKIYRTCLSAFIKKEEQDYYAICE